MTRWRGGAPQCAQFAVVINPGTLFERIDAWAATLKDAIEWAADTRAIEGCPVDVMKVTNTGLTTEF